MLEIESKMKAPTILVVEDESIVAMDMERRLRGLGYTVAGRVLTGEDAVTQDAILKPDVVLMDIHLKGEMDGIEAASIIRKQRDVPVIYITAYSDQATLERAKETQPHGYILKPFQEREIHSVIEMALYKHRSEAELLRAKQAAEEGLRVRNEFLANMSHEFRTPLNSILGMANLARETVDNPEVKEYLELLVESGNGLLDMVNAVLDYSRLETGRMEVTLSLLDLPGIVRRLEARFRHQAGRQENRFIITVSEELPSTLVCDSEKYYQIIQNLVSNALKFTHRGTVTLELSAAEPIGEAGGRIRISVTDTGIGITPEQKELIFRPFTQADGSATRTYGGTGLGLSIVKRFVDQCGGVIEVSSEEGRGSRFEVVLPVFSARTDAGTRKELSVVLSPETKDHACTESVADFVEFARRMVRLDGFEQIEHAAELLKGRMLRGGNGKTADNILRVLLGARKRSVEKIGQALDILEEECGIEGT